MPSHDQLLLQRDAIVGHAEAIRTQSRKPSKAHTHKKRQPTNAGQPHSTRRKEATPQLGAAHAASEDTTHTSNHTACHQGRKRRPARRPPRAQQVSDYLCMPNYCVCNIVVTHPPTTCLGLSRALKCNSGSYDNLCRFYYIVWILVKYYRKGKRSILPYLLAKESQQC